MLKFLLITLATLILSIAAFSQTAQDKLPCEAIKGKTYLGWNEGTWESPSVFAVNSHRIIFDSNGRGVSREFFVLNETGAAQQIKRTVVCEILPDGKSSLRFNEGSRLLIISYDNGAKVWCEQPLQSRPTKGWMLQLPPPPPKKIFPF